MSSDAGSTAPDAVDAGSPLVLYFDAAPEPDAPQFVIYEDAAVERRGKISDYATRVDETPKQAAVAEDSEYTEEDGVPVAVVKVGAWCAETGSLKGICIEKRNECLSALKARCSQHSAWACYRFVQRTSQQVRVVCADTYGHCAGLRRASELDDETGSLDPCVIFRVKK